MNYNIIMPKAQKTGLGKHPLDDTLKNNKNTNPLRKCPITNYTTVDRISHAMCRIYTTASPP